MHINGFIIPPIIIIPLDMIPISLVQPIPLPHSQPIPIIPIECIEQAQVICRGESWCNG